MSKVWMITGAGRGLGRAFTEEAVRNGDQVIATVRKINPADGLLTNEKGNTAIVAEMIADATGADMFGIRLYSRENILREEPSRLF